MNAALAQLLRLYPRSWRERYGREFADLLESQPLTFGLVIDVVFGAVDARVRPQTIVRLASRPDVVHGEGVRTMLSEVMKLRCAGFGPGVTRRDQWLAAAVAVGGTAVLSFVYIGLHVRFGDNAYVDSFSMMPIFAGLLLSFPFTYLKGRPAVSQVAFIGLGLTLLVAVSLLIGVITARI